MDITEVFGLPLSHPERWEEALTHRSFAFQEGTASNERLEFLGDAILGMVMAFLLFEQTPRLSEGELTRCRAAAVRESRLAHVARELGLGQHLRLGYGEEQAGGRDKRRILADCLEAVLGAHCLDRGLDETRVVIERLFWPPPPDRNCKGLLNELALQQFGVEPEYVFTAEGPDHEKEYTATVSLRDEKYGVGQGRSKKEAGQQAACKALERIAVAGPGIDEGGRLGAM